MGSVFSRMPLQPATTSPMPTRDSIFMSFISFSTSTTVMSFVKILSSSLFSLHLRPFFYLSFRFPIHISFINPPSLFLFSDDKKKIMEWINQSAHRWALSSEYISFSFLYTYKLYLYFLLLVLRPFFFDFFLLHHLLLPSFFNNCLLIQLSNLLVLCLSVSFS